MLANVSKHYTGIAVLLIPLSEFADLLTSLLALATVIYELVSDIVLL